MRSHLQKYLIKQKKLKEKSKNILNTKEENNKINEIEDGKEDKGIKLNPYFAKSKNLIEKFIIIGYKEENILKFLSNNVEGNNKLILSIISEFKLNSFDCYESDFLIKQVYPEDPNIILVSNSISKPKIVNITFYSCVDTKDGKKNTINYFALKFHEKYINYNTNKEYYIPKAYLIVSKYPYFTLYHQICSYILKNNENNKIPIEVLIYYLINNIPSPIKQKRITELETKNKELNDINNNINLINENNKKQIEEIKKKNEELNKEINDKNKEIENNENNYKNFNEKIKENEKIINKKIK